MAIHRSGPGRPCRLPSQSPVQHKNGKNMGPLGSPWPQYSTKIDVELETRTLAISRHIRRCLHVNCQVQQLTKRSSTDAGAESLSLMGASATAPILYLPSSPVRNHLTVTVISDFMTLTTLPTPPGPPSVMLPSGHLGPRATRSPALAGENHRPALASNGQESRRSWGRRTTSHGFVGSQRYRKRRIKDTWGKYKRYVRCMAGGFYRRPYSVFLCSGYSTTPRH